MGSNLMKFQTKITVAMPVFNGERFLRPAIESILNQSFSDFEFIIIDDGSTDNSLAILREYEKVDSRIRVISRENRNVAATLNEIIELAKGEWIARMDQDDISYPERFEVQLDWIKNTGADICGSWARRFGANDARVVRTLVSDADIKFQMMFQSPFIHPSVMMRSSFAKQLRYNEINWQAEDYDFWFRAIKAGCVMANVPSILLGYRVHSSQISSKSILRQEEISKSVRRQYWSYYACRNFNIFLESDIEILIKGSDGLLSMTELQVFNAILEKLSALGTPGQRDAVINHARICYYRNASNINSITKEWIGFCRSTDSELNILFLIKLMVIRVLRLNRSSRVYGYLRSFHIFLFK